MDPDRELCRDTIAVLQRVARYALWGAYERDLYENTTTEDHAERQASSGEKKDVTGFRSNLGGNVDGVVRLIPESILENDISQAIHCKDTPARR